MRHSAGPATSRSRRKEVESRRVRHVSIDCAPLFNIRRGLRIRVAVSKQRFSRSIFLDYVPLNFRVRLTQRQNDFILLYAIPCTRIVFTISEMKYSYRVTVVFIFFQITVEKLLSVLFFFFFAKIIQTLENVCFYN